MIAKAKIVNITEKVREKQQQKLALEILKSLEEMKSFYDYEGIKMSNDSIATVIREKLEWFAM